MSESAPTPGVEAAASAIAESLPNVDESIQNVAGALPNVDESVPSSGVHGQRGANRATL